MACQCHIVGLLNINYSGIFSASLNGGTNVTLSSDGTVLLGATLNTLAITAYAFSPGGNRFLGATCPASASASVQWVQRYDCATNTTHFIPKSGGKASILNGPINNVSLQCDPNISSMAFNASAQSGPTTPYITNTTQNGFNLSYTGTPIQIESGSASPVSIDLGVLSVEAYLQSFSLTINPPSPATVSYNFVVPGTIT